MGFFKCTYYTRHIIALLIVRTVLFVATLRASTCLGNVSGSLPLSLLAFDMTYTYKPDRACFDALFSVARGDRQMVVLPNGIL